MFITFEGGEGAGKTTQIVHLAGYLSGAGIPCILTREPGGTDLGKKIRAVLLHPDNAGMAPETELLLYMADRAEHIQTVIRPALNAGKTVLCDRFSDATMVYQGTARGLPPDGITQLHDLVFGNFKPDITFLLDLAPEIGLARARRQMETGGRPDAERRFEEETLGFHRRVREGYLTLARQEPERFRVIQADQDEDRVRSEIESAIKPFMKNRLANRNRRGADQRS
jgi:dTMP kinase